MLHRDDAGQLEPTLNGNDRRCRAGPVRADDLATKGGHGHHVSSSFRSGTPLNDRKSKRPNRSEPLWRCTSPECCWRTVKSHAPVMVSKLLSRLGYEGGQYKKHSNIRSPSIALALPSAKGSGSRLLIGAFRILDYRRNLFNLLGNLAFLFIVHREHFVVLPSARLLNLSLVVLPLLNQSLEFILQIFAHLRHVTGRNRESAAISRIKPKSHHVGSTVLSRLEGIR
jgi:hypothetical protein